MFQIRPILSALLRHKSSTLLIVLQIAITLAVVVNAVFIIVERIKMIDSKSGLPEKQIITLAMSAFGEDYDVRGNMDADLELLRNLPGVIDATFVNAVPLGHSGDSSSVSSKKENRDDVDNLNVAFYRGDSHLLNSFGAKLASGRNYQDNEVVYSTGYADPKVVLVTQSLADRLFPDGDALGKTLYYADYDLTIIGIVESLVSPWVHHRNHNMAVITPLVTLQNFKRLAVHAEPDAVNELLSSLETELINRNPNRVIYSVRTMSENRELSYREDAAMMKILTVVVVLLVSITALGIVGIVTFNINQRIKQIGTRRALGANQFNIQQYFITENILITSMGLTIGTMLALSFNIYLVDTFQLPPIDWQYIPIGMIMMLLTGLIAVWLPAKRASLVSPAVATQSI